jgi:hypothetical protein
MSATANVCVFWRLEQTASLMVDNGEVITGSAPGQLRQLNTQAGLYLGGSLLYLNKKVAVSADFSDSEYNIFSFAFKILSMFDQNFSTEWEWPYRLRVLLHTFNCSLVVH